MRWGICAAAVALAVATLTATATAAAPAAIAPAPLCAGPPRLAKHGWVPATFVPGSVLAKIKFELVKRGWKLCGRPTTRPVAACSQARPGTKAYQVVVLVACPSSRLRLRVRARVQAPRAGDIKVLSLNAKRVPAPPPPRSKPPPRPPISGGRMAPPRAPPGPDRPDLPDQPYSPPLTCLVPPLSGCGWTIESSPLCELSSQQRLRDGGAYEAVDAGLRQQGFLASCQPSSYIPGIQLTGGCLEVGDGGMDYQLYRLTYEIECGGERLSVRASLVERLPVFDSPLKLQNVLVIP